MKEIIRDLSNGNSKGTGYTIKEILTAHIYDDKELHEEILREIRDIKKRYAPTAMVMGIFSLLVGWLGWVTIQLWRLR